MTRAVPASLVLVTVIAAATTSAQPVPTPARKLDIARHGCENIREMKYSANGQVLAVGGTGVANTNPVLVLWSASDGRHLRTFRGNDAAERFALSSDGQILAVPVEREGEVVLWDVTQGKELRRLSHPSVHEVRFSPAGNILVSVVYQSDSDRKADELRVWDYATGKQLFSTTSQPGVRTAFAADGRLLFWTSDRRLRCWDPETRKERQPAVLPTDTDTYLTPSPSGNEVLVCNLDSDRIRLHDAATGKVLHTFPDGKDFVEDRKFSQDGKLLVLLRHSGSIEVWDTATGVRRSSFRRSEPDKRTFSPWADLVPDGKHVMVRRFHWTSDGHGAFTHTTVYTLDGRLVRHAPEARDVVFDPSGRSVAVWGDAPATPGRPPETGLAIHDTAAWLAGGAKKD
jgi:WD40 repeat protein